MEENNNIKISFAKNLNKFNFSTLISVPIDSNVNIKTILDINSYMYDQKVECGSGKAILTGKIGIKVLYIDTDNITNTLSDTQNFSETIVDASITNDTYLNIFNTNIVNNILSADNILKINCEVTVNPIAYLNLGINSNLPTSEMLISKKSELKTNTISKHVCTQCEYTTNLETKDNITKILCNNNYFTAEKTTANDGYFVVEGKILSSVIYETTKDNETIIKEIRELFNVKCDIEIEGLSRDNILDLCFTLDKANENISTELEDNQSIITTKHTIKACGVVLKSISIDVIDDVYSSENEIETTIAKREYTKNAEHYTISEVISNDITLTNTETAIDEMIANLNMVPEITNTYIKDNNIFVEGIISSNLTYVDENKEIKNKTVEVPFIINTKIKAENLGFNHSEVYIIDNRVKVKRGTIIELEYSILISLTMFEKETREMIDTFTIGKPINFGDYDYQIFIAKQGETMWDLCKRIKISPDNINQYNKNLPLIMEGGEKVIIKR